jgi:secreted trypsin-like serine protease
MKNRFLIILSLFSFNLFAIDQTPTIVNGVEVTANSLIARTTVMITGKYQRFSFTCSGSILAKDLIITAAHCLGPYGDAKITVFFGLNKNKPGITYKVIKQKMPETYISSSQATYDRNDVALLLLEKPIPPNYQPAVLMDDLNLLQNGDVVTLAGYGINVQTMPSRGDGGIGILRSVEQNILEAQYGNTEVLISIKNKGTCGGDSGGPAILKKDNQFYLFGVASRLTAKDIVPGSNPTRYECIEEIVYTNILKQLEWLKRAEAELRKN